MRLNPKEQEKLMLHMAGNLAKERRARGLKLNYPEALAYMDGVADMIGEVQVEATFPDGTKLVTVHNPIQ